MDQTKFKTTIISILALTALITSVTYALNYYHKQRIYNAQQAYYKDQYDQCFNLVYEKHGTKEDANTEQELANDINSDTDQSAQSAASILSQTIDLNIKNPDYQKGSNECYQQWGKYIMNQ